ncbi:orotidine-5'-phosphate decarboxylase [Jeotgalibacillus soli]|uniref:Orotidine 5'-phosphate decarboxylase n=1 Tax=Jeotgalibacillus soli TaxID=889306 RepID=A0A0C2VK21_9BACL|nr:orotidine-5'-phosphate decarboxylase [Jeotgalibacillus soli]KIL44826.1 orotidine 5'-phosphate decarboxylase [Jeotgalibacillus soli]
MVKQPIIALDMSTFKEVERFLQLFQESLYVKVGMELYLQNGPIIIERLKEQDHQIFLDLKLHDIPTTVKKAMKGLASLGVDMINVHAAGGKRMMEEALEGLEQGAGGAKRPKLLAVTQLTSTSQAQMQKEQRIATCIQESVLHYALLAKEAGLDGVVCSPLEAKQIAQAAGEDFWRVTPGVRLERGIAHDQIRTATPADAKLLGSSAIVVGRAITDHQNPVEAYEIVRKEWEEE